MKLKETGERTYTGDNFKKMREKFRRNKNEDSTERKLISKPKERSKRHFRENSNERIEKESIL
jgi:hypothetical protein